MPDIWAGRDGDKRYNPAQIGHREPAPDWILPGVPAPSWTTYKSDNQQYDQYEDNDSDGIITGACRSIPTVPS